MAVIGKQTRKDVREVVKVIRLFLDGWGDTERDADTYAAISRLKKELRRKPAAK